jgi:hypothetical protein
VKYGDMKEICRQCQKEFKPKNKGQKCCSVSCSRKYMAKHRIGFYGLRNRYD